MLTTTMWSEVRRPQFLDEVVGHREVKSRLQSYLTTKPHSNVILLHGSPGIGKTTMALAAIRSAGMEPEVPGPPASLIVQMGHTKKWTPSCTG